MRLNIEFYIICASLVGSVAPKWLIEDPPAKIAQTLIARKAALADAGAVSTTTTTEYTINWTPNTTDSRGYLVFKAEDVGYGELDMDAAYYEPLVKEVLKAHQKKMKTAERLAALTGEPAEEPELDINYELERTAREMYAENARPRLSATVEGAKFTADELAESERLYAKIYGPLNREEQQWASRHPIRISRYGPKRICTRSLNDDDEKVDEPGPQGSVGDGSNQDTQSDLELFSKPLAEDLREKTVKRSVEPEDAAQPSIPSWKYPNKVGSSAPIMAGHGSVTDDIINSAPDTIPAINNFGTDSPIGHQGSHGVRARRQLIGTICLDTCMGYERHL